MAVSALVLGIVGLILSLNLFTSFTGLLCGILAIIFGAIGVSKKDSDSGKGVAGIVLGAITLIIIILIIILVKNICGIVIENLPKILEEIGETIVTTIADLENAVSNMVEDAADIALDNLF